MAQDFYDVLGVSKSASDDEIKKAYRKMAMQFHPDKNKGDKTAEAKFKEINEAYEVLKDSQKKAAYDRFGHSAFTQGGGGAGGGFGGGGFEGFSGFSGGSGFSPFSDLFEAFFRQSQDGGDSGDFNNSRMQESRKGNDIRYNLELSLDEAFKGKKTKLRFSTLMSCVTCNSTGSASGAKPATCGTCNGRGQVRFQQALFVVERTCHACGGSGQLISDPCKTCHGQGRHKREKNIEVEIPAGVDDGARVRVSGQGEAGVRGGPNGDLYIFVTVKQHRVFKRQQETIHCKVPINIAQAALGATIEVPTIDGGKADVVVPAGTQHGHQIRVKGKGMPHLRGSSRGDMLVELSLEVPVNLTKKQKELLQEFSSDLTKEKNTPLSHGFFSKVKDFWDDLQNKTGL